MASATLLSFCSGAKILPILISSMDATNTPIPYLPILNIDAFDAQQDKREEQDIDKLHGEKKDAQRGTFLELLEGQAGRIVACKHCGFLRYQWNIL